LIVKIEYSEVIDLALVWQNLTAHFLSSRQILVCMLFPENPRSFCTSLQINRILKIKPMKKFTLTFIFFLFAIAMLAQVPAGFSYQAVVRNTSGEVVANQTVNFKFSILQNSTTGTPVYVETQSKNTNDFGLANLTVGSGTLVSGIFNPATWGNNFHFLKVELDPNNGNTFSHLGTMQLMAVPYAFHAQTVGEISDNSVTSAKIASGAVTGAKIAQAGASTGQALKWNGTVWAPDNDNASGEFTLPVDKTGNAAGSAFKITNTNISDESSAITGVSSSNIGAGVYGFADNINSSLNSGVKGVTNSIGGTGVIGSNTSLTGNNKGVWGRSYSPTGVGVTGHHNSNTGKGYGVLGLTYSVDGYGLYGQGPNVGVKGEATATSGSSIGLHGVSKAPDGLGVYAEASHTSGTNTGVRGISHSSSGEGVQGSALSYTGTTVGIRGYVNSSSGYSGFFNGGRFHVSGRVGIGEYEPQAGLHLKGASFPNSFMYIESNTGQDAGIRLYEGSTVKWHIFNNSALAGLQIYNNSGNNAIFCKQSNSFVGLGTTAPTQKLHVVGNAYKTEGGTSWASSSDLRLKTILGEYEKGLNEITALNPVRFRYLENNPRELLSDIEQVGFVAQDVQEIFPEAVTEAEDGYLDFNIHAINIALVNAIKELKAENDRLISENEQFKSDKHEILNRLDKLEKILSGFAEIK
jgi:hypothetical protein